MRIASASRSAPARPIRLRIVAALLPLLALAACEDLGVGSDGQPQDQIVFLSNRDILDPAGAFLPPTDIFVMNADGTGARNLTRRPDYHYNSYSVSADEGKIAFSSYRSSSCSNIHVLNTDGTGLAQRTTSHCNFDPRWSPDGSRLAYLSHRAGGNPAVITMDADGTGERDVSTAALGGETGCTGPEPPQIGMIGWAPGDRVVFHHYRCTLGYYFFISGAEGGAPAPMPFDPTWAYWSPDGSRVAFTEAGRLMVMNADGSGRHQVTDGQAVDYIPPRRNAQEISPWSPDGTRLVFSRRPDVGGTWVIDVDGSGLLRLPVPEPNAFNGWSPRGNMLAFTVGAGGSREVYVMNADGTGLVNLTNNPADDQQARWVPAR